MGYGACLSVILAPAALLSAARESAWKKEKLYFRTKRKLSVKNFACCLAVKIWNGQQWCWKFWPSWVSGDKAGFVWHSGDENEDDDEVDCIAFSEPSAESQNVYRRNNIYVGKSSDEPKQLLFCYPMKKHYQNSTFMEQKLIKNLILKFDKLSGRI